MTLAIQISLSYLFCLALVSCFCSKDSGIDKYELDNIRYQIDIDQNVQPLSAIESKNNNIQIRSANGQLFTCSFEPWQTYDQDFELNTEENSLLSLFTKSTEHDQNLNQNQNKKIFNFTQIDSQVQKQVSKLNESNFCLLKNNGWWTYEFCFGKYINQYHLLSNGSIQGEIISLGNYSHDFDWSKANETKKFPIRSDILYHKQYFEFGNLCELSGKPRRTTVKMFCDERGPDRIEMISEIETCVYEIFVHTQTLCSVPNFSQKQISHDLKCSPVVTDQVFENYKAKKEKESAQLAQEESQILSDIDQLTDINKELEQELESSEKKLKNLISKTQELNSDQHLDKLNSIIEETNLEMNKNDQIYEKLSKKLDNILDEMDSGKVGAQENPSLFLSQTTEIFNDADEINVQELEQKLKEKLKSKNLPQNNIKIKIIKLNSNELFGTNDFNSLISNLASNSDDKLKMSKINANYNQVYDENNFAQDKNTANDDFDDLLFKHEIDSNNLVIY